jgi:drug/metabolite transporter (DMT)-like permease
MAMQINREVAHGQNGATKLHEEEFMSTSPDNASFLVLSYLSLRKAIGLLGACLPFVLAIGLFVLYRKGLQGSISGYYHTEMRDVFVGTLCAIGVFLLSYRGYESKDRIAGNLACVFAIGTALFPTAPDVMNPTHMDNVKGAIHFISAALFLLTLAYFSLRLFTKTDPKLIPTPRKTNRNRIYLVCGYTIVAAIALIAIYKVLPNDIEMRLAELKPVFWLESIAVVAFGISWLTKGEAILKDQT